MFAIDELSEELRSYARRYNSPPFGREIEGTAELLDQAADAIDILSEKLTMVNQEEKQCRKALSNQNGLKAQNAIQMMKDEWLLYHKVGTVTECREAMEKQRAKKIKNRELLRDFYNRPYSIRGDCPNCGAEGIMSINADYCNSCGQKLDWESED